MRRFHEIREIKEVHDPDIERLHQEVINAENRRRALEHKRRGELLDQGYTKRQIDEIMVSKEILKQTPINKDELQQAAIVETKQLPQRHRREYRDIDERPPAQRNHEDLERLRENVPNYHMQPDPIQITTSQTNVAQEDKDIDLSEFDDCIRDDTNEEIDIEELCKTEQDYNDCALTDEEKIVEFGDEILQDFSDCEITTPTGPIIGE